MEQVRLRGDCFRGDAGIAKACRVVDQRRFLIGAIAGDEPVDAHTGRGRAGRQARSTQDLATINRHPPKLPQPSGWVYRSEGVDVLDADEHAMPGVLVGEPGAAFVGRDRPAVRIVGEVVDGHGRDVAEVAYYPLHRTARGDVHAVGAFAVLHRGIGELGFATHAVGVDLAARLTGFGFDEHATVLVGRKRDGAGRRIGAR